MTMMKTLTVGEFKSRFADVLEMVKGGEKVAVTYGRRKQVIGCFVPWPLEPSKERELGVLAGKGELVIHDDFKITDEELVTM